MSKQPQPVFGNAPAKSPPRKSGYVDSLECAGSTALFPKMCDAGGPLEPIESRKPILPQADSAELAGVKEFSALLKPLPKKEVLSKLARTEEEIEQLKREGFAAGYEEGFEKGKEAGFQAGLLDGRIPAYEEAALLKKEELRAFREELVRTVSKVQQALQQWFEQSENGLAQLAVLIAQRIVAKELAIDPKAILAMTAEAVSEVTHATHARIKVHPFDSAILEANRAEILAAAHSVRDLEIVEDDTLVGGCVIETDGGVVDATIDMKFEEMLDQIRRTA